MGAMDGLSGAKIIEKIKRDWPIYMLADLSFWPIFQLFNFRFVQIKYQTLAIYTATLAYTVVMSTIESRNVEEDITETVCVKE
jgi:hypothetical protein